MTNNTSTVDISNSEIGRTVYRAFGFHDSDRLADPLSVHVVKEKDERGRDVLLIVADKGKEFKQLSLNDDAMLTYQHAKINEGLRVIVEITAKGRVTEITDIWDSRRAKVNISEEILVGDEEFEVKDNIRRVARDLFPLVRPLVAAPATPEQRTILPSEYQTDETSPMPVDVEKLKASVGPLKAPRPGI